MVSMWDSVVTVWLRPLAATAVTAVTAATAATSGWLSVHPRQERALRENTTVSTDTTIQLCSRSNTDAIGAMEAYLQ